MKAGRSAIFALLLAWGRFPEFPLSLRSPFFSAVSLKILIAKSLERADPGLRPQNLERLRLTQNIAKSALRSRLYLGDRCHALWLWQ